jgi:hypothetical protein
MGATRIAVGWIHPGDVAGCFTESLAYTLLRDRKIGRIQSIIGLQSSPRIAEARCQMVDGFLNQTRDEWLLSIDADMAWDFDAFETIVKHADPDTVPIIGGLCFAGGRSWKDNKPTIRPTIYRIGDGGMTEIVENYERDSLVQVGATGAAFLLVHRRVFKAMQKAAPNDPHPWFAERYIQGRSVGEDITFCLRAQACGFPVHVHTGAKIAHRKSFFLTEELYDEVNQ